MTWSDKAIFKHNVIITTTHYIYHPKVLQTHTHVTHVHAVQYKNPNVIYHFVLPATSNRKGGDDQHPGVDITPDYCYFLNDNIYIYIVAKLTTNSNQITSPYKVTFESALFREVFV